MEEKICIDCGKTLPLSTDHWHKAKDGSWEPRCKPCRSEYRKKHRRLRRKTMRKRREKALAKIEQQGIDMFAELSRTGGPLIPHSDEVLERLMEYFGGTACHIGMVCYALLFKAGAFKIIKEPACSPSSRSCSTGAPFQERRPHRLEGAGRQRDGEAQGKARHRHVPAPLPGQPAHRGGREEKGD
jgi:hypothetical protein